ncbi:protein ARABIDILLO 1 [Quercus lobata]|uniref:protein ARABIDILLO 1 n=1 Tax=Quercus lobata TaxID=97700 RepID=UPI001246AD0E|nr:protein ARABIDILLO 1 [Quercus lobata]
MTNYNLIREPGTFRATKSQRRIECNLTVAIGREGGVAPLIALARSESVDVHETAAGALWNLAFNPGNALCIVEEGGVPALVHLCSSSQLKMAWFMAALALACMFDGSYSFYLCDRYDACS